VLVRYATALLSRHSFHRNKFGISYHYHLTSHLILQNLIDAVIAHNAAFRLANAQGVGASGGSGSGGGSSGSNSSQRANARGQPNAPARPSIPIATKQLPYTSVAAYGRNSVESTPRANAINIPSPSRGDASPTSSSRPRHPA